MSWIVSKQFRFEAAHMLPFHDGACQRLHGHSYQFSLFVNGNKLQPSGPKTGMVMDFKDLGTIGKEIVHLLDHQYLNAVLKSDVTTAEWMASWMYRFVLPKLPRIWAVEIKETESSLVRYCPGEGRLLELGNTYHSQIKTRLLSNVLVGEPNECWPFTGSKDAMGYGYCNSEIAGTNKAHRLTAWLEGWDIEGMVVMHKCDNPSCCNPAHLQVGTHKENEKDKDSKNRRPRGESHGSSYLKDTEVLEFWRDFQKNGKQKGFLKKWGLRLKIRSPQLLNNIVQGWTWNHITGLPKRASK